MNTSQLESDLEAYLHANRETGDARMAIVQAIMLLTKEVRRVADVIGLIADDGVTTHTTSKDRF